MALGPEMVVKVKAPSPKNSLQLTGMSKRRKSQQKVATNGDDQNEKPMDLDISPAQEQHVSSSDKGLKASLMEENQFISSVLSHLHVPTHKNQELDEDEVDLGVSDNRQLFAPPKDRAKTISELRERYDHKMNELRGQRDKDLHGKKTKKGQGKVDRKKLKGDRLLQKKLTVKANGKSRQSGDQGKKKGLGHQVKPVFNSSGKMVFSKFDFTEEDSKSDKKQNLDPKAALKKMQKEKEKIKSLESIGKTERVKNMEEKTAWKTALDKAEGVKVKDDETLLKKSVKKLEQKKKASKKKWEARHEQVDKRKDHQQTKRADNVQKRKDAKKQKKAKKALKKGRMLPGFQ